MPRRTGGATLTDQKRKIVAETMIYHHLRYKSSWAECWLITHPNSGAKRESRRVMANRQVKWYINCFPSGYAKVHRQAVRDRERDDQQYLEALRQRLIRL